MKSKTSSNRCPSCESRNLRLFYRAGGVPVHSVMLLRSRNEALGFPVHDIELGLCRRCGHIANLCFDPDRMAYSGDCEEAQDYSPTFRKFQRSLVEDLAERHGLCGGHVLEVGCGKGEFLKQICTVGDCRGTGYDPAWVDGRSAGPDSDRVEFVARYFGPDCQAVAADLVVCKMTLEHIARPFEFIRMIADQTAGNQKAVYFFQVPDMERILDDGAFWDVYYEHCSYFTTTSLRSLFERAGYKVKRLRPGYDGQYLLLEAERADQKPTGYAAGEEIQRLEKRVDHFENNVFSALSGWRVLIEGWHAVGKRVVVWGGGSKAVAFLNLIGDSERIHSVVDINPHKQGMFIAGTGHLVVAPSELAKLKPDAVILMNPVYRDEINQVLSDLGLEPEIRAL